MPWLVMPKHFSFLDDERLLVAGLQRQREVRQDERDFVAGFVVLRAANDDAFAFAIVDFADGELVRAGHRVAREDLGDDDAFELAADFVDAFGFEAEHGEPFGQFLGRPVEINVLFEPVEGDFHRDGHVKQVARPSQCLEFRYNHQVGLFILQFRKMNSLDLFRTPAILG